MPPGSKVDCTDNAYMTDATWIKLAPDIAKGIHMMPVINSLTAIRVLVGTKNSHPVGFYSRNSTKSAVNLNTTIPQI